MNYREEITRIEAKLAPELEQVAHYLYENPELGMEEQLAAQRLVEYMTEKGFAVEFSLPDAPIVSTSSISAASLKSYSVLFVIASFPLITLPAAYVSLGSVRTFAAENNSVSG